jgi:hypothetical protein
LISDDLHRGDAVLEHEARQVHCIEYVFGGCQVIEANFGGPVVGEGDDR